MWFKQLQLFQFADAISYSPQALAEKLEPLLFRPCLPSMHASIGWTSPFLEDDAPLTHAANGYIMLCLQIEEKILPATVIRQELQEKIKKIEAANERKVRQKEKLSLKDEVVLTLLPRAFTKLTQIYAYIDTKNNWLILNTTHAKHTEQFISLFKKSVSDAIHPCALKKLSPIITHWVKEKSYPEAFSIEKACMLQDPEQQNRIIRCQHQDLFASAIQAFIKDGCVVKQLALNWQERLNFVLTDDFSIRSIQYQEEILSQIKDLEIETKQQQFDADFFIMTTTLTGLLNDLIALFKTDGETNQVIPLAKSA